MEHYLKRFSATQKDPSLNNLTELQKLHLQHIPFENLDVIRKTPIYLNLKTIYEKIVKNRRGGYCYELNGLFQSLLTELGYTAHLISATVLRPNGEWAKADTHAAILVYLDEPYLVDVGFGAATPRKPVPLQSMTETNVGETYRIKQQTETTYDLIRKTDSSERTLYRFCSNQKELLDFHEGCVFNQVSEASTFTHTDIVSLATETGRVTLHDQVLTKTKNGVTEEFQLSAEEKEHALENIFSLSLK